MNVHDIRIALKAKPFVPFSLRMVDGRTYCVFVPDYMSVPPVERPRAVLYYEPIDNGTDDYLEHYLEPDLIAELVIDPIGTTK